MLTIAAIALALLCSSCAGIVGGGSESIAAAPTQGVTLSATSVTFSDQIINTSSLTQIVNLTNNGGAAITISSVTVAGPNVADFSLGNTCGSSVAPGAGCSASVSFTPSAAGSRTASLMIADSVVGSPQAVSLSGTGDYPHPTLSTLSVPSAVAGASAQDLTLNGSGFVASSAVTYNGVGHGAAFVSSTQLIISLSTADQATSGSYPVVVTNPTPGGGVSNALNFNVTGNSSNPQPFLTSLSPPLALVGASAQTLTLNGSGFVASSTVTYNGGGHAATFVSSSQLTIALSAGDQATAGIYPVVVTTPAPDGGTSGTLNFAVNNPAPSLASLSPPSAIAGAAAQTLTLNGSGFIANSTVTYNGVGHTATFVSTSQLTISLNASDQTTAQNYPVFVTNPGPGGGTSNGLNFAVNSADNPQPILANLSPPAAIVGTSAQSLTLNGTGFVAASTVTYNGASHAATFVSATQLTISLSAPDQATAGSYAVVVTNPGPGGGTSAAVNFAVNNPAPSLTNLAPSSAQAGAAAQTLTLNGSGFVANSTVTYNGADHPATFINASQLTILLSADDQATAGNRPVVITNPGPGGGSSNALNFQINNGNNPQPTLTSLSPPSALVGASAQTLMLNGTGFISSSTVTFDGVSHAATYVSPTQLTIALSVSDQTTSGSYPVVVTNPGPGGGTSAATNFVVNNPAPNLASISPPSATAGSSGQALTLNGMGFIATSTVTFNGVGHAATIMTSTQLTISLTTADQATAGSYPVVVTNPGPGGGSSSPLDFAVNNLTVGVTSLSPPSAIAGAGTQSLTINGTGFLTTSTVAFAGAGHTATYLSSTQLTITLSASDQATAGNYPVVVMNPGVGSSTPLNFVVNNPAPNLTSLAPPSAFVGASAQTLTLNGSGFVPSSTVMYNGAGHTVTYVGSTQLTISLSTGDQATAGNYSVMVTNPGPGGGTSGSLSFAVNDPAPILISLAPPSAAAGTSAQTLTLNGSGFTPGSTVTYNGIGHAVTYVSSTQLTTILSAPDQANAGSYPVVVVNPSPGGGTSGAVSFGVNNPAPSLTSLLPASATAGASAQTLTLNGSGFIGSSTVTFNGASHAATFIAPTQMTISLSSADQATAGNYPVVVTNPAPGGGTSNTLNFSVSVSDNPQPTLSSLSPPSAVVGATAQTLTLNGSGFVSSSTVTYNGVAHAATFVSSSQLTISLSTNDQAAAGSFPVVVTTAGPGGGTSAALNFAVDDPPPSLASLSPPSALVGAGAQTLTLNGTGFLANSTVTYNAVAHTATYVSSTQLTISLSAPDQATAGSFAVVVTNPAPGGGSSGALNFAVNNPGPSLTSLSPTSAVAGAAAQTLTLTGTGFLTTSTITYNGAGHTATYVSSTQLTITLSVADQATAGNFPVVVTNPAPSGGSSGVVNFTVNNPAPSLTSLSPPSTAVGTNAQTLTLNGSGFVASSTVTYNGTGHTATYVSSSQITILLSTADQASVGDFPVVVTNSGPGGGTSNTLNFVINGITVGLSTTSLDFVGQPFQTTSAPQTVTLTNNGSASLNVTNVAISGNNAGDFGQTNTCGNPVTSGNTCTINVTYTPSTSQTETATLTITDNAAGSPQQVNLTGTGASVAVNWSIAHQVIDGFGGAAVDSAQSLTPSLATFFFSPTSGIGLSIVRVQVIPDNATCTAACGGNPNCGCAASSGATIFNGELGIVQQAQALGVSKFFASSWSPPASMKSNDSWSSGGTFLGGNANYAAYATLLESYVNLLSSKGVTLYGMSPQNEPDILQSYASCIWSGQQFHDFVPYLSSALAASGVPAIKIIMPENAAWSGSYAGFASTTMSDPNVAPDVGLLAQHGYSGDGNIVAPTNFGYGQHLWMTEDSSQSSTYDGSMSDALSWAVKIHNYLATAQVNAFVWWFLSDMPGNGDGTDNAALTDINGNIPLRAYITGNWSKFVRPGWNRVDVTNSGSLLVTAFESADGTQTAVVVVNNSSSDDAQTLSVGTQMGTSVVPWITSASQLLLQQPAVAISGGTLTYTVPANSVVTFVGQPAN